MGIDGQHQSCFENTKGAEPHQFTSCIFVDMAALQPEKGKLRAEMD